MLSESWLVSYEGGCVCRLRIGAAAQSRPPFPNRISAFEKAVRSYDENTTDNVITLVIGTTFDSVGEAYDFYNLYSWEKGSGIRYEMSKCGEDKVHARNCLLVITT